MAEAALDFEMTTRILFANKLSGLPSPLTAAGGQTVSEYHGVDRTGARSGDAFERESFFLKQAIEHTPRKRAVATPTLEREINDLLSRFGGAPNAC